MQVCLLTGSGRSGTNWLLDMLDTSPWTRCRNEPLDLTDGTFTNLPLVWNPGPQDAAFYDRRWEAMTRSAARRLGPYDHHFRYPKEYLTTGTRGLTRLLTGPRARQLMSPGAAQQRDREIDIPRWMLAGDSMADSHLVLKMLVDADMVSWLLANDEATVVHALRHPGGRLNSWWRRLVSERDVDGRAELRQSRVARLELIRDRDPEWREILPSPLSMSLVDAELWFWRYVNETTWRAAHAHPGYQLLRFDEVASSPLQSARTLFNHVGLDWDDRTASAIEADLGRSVFGLVTNSGAVATAWRSQLNSELLEAVDRVLTGSILWSLIEG